MDAGKRITGSKWLATVTVILFGIYLFKLFSGPSIEPEKTIRGVICSLIFIPFVLICGIISIVLGWRERKAHKEILFWLIPVLITLSLPVLFFLAFTLFEFLAAHNLFFK